MSDRTFVLAMWNDGHREWDDGFALEWLMTSAESFGRGISTSRHFFFVLREVRDAQRRYEQLRLDGYSPSVALSQMALNGDTIPAGLDPQPRGRQPGKPQQQP